jgi:two-component system sensor histidine kinase KdpD
MQEKSEGRRQCSVGTIVDDELDIRRLLRRALGGSGYLLLVEEGEGEEAAAGDGLRGEELKWAVLDALAHDIRNAFVSIRFTVTILLSGQQPVEEERRKTLLGNIDKELQRVDRCIDETVQLSRLGTSELTLRKEPQDIGRVISGALQEMASLSGSRAIKLRVPESLPRAYCDRAMILCVLKQLVSNALKYSPVDSPLTVSAEHTGAAIVVSVVDCGPGVAEDEKERIFEMFYRGQAADSGALGTGLGLASAKIIARAHGGDIWVTTPVEGGSAFHVSLPVASA